MLAREHANLRLDMWGDEDWRALSMPAQWLYELLLTHPKTNRAGVCDWRPKRLAPLARGVSAADVRAMSVELEAGFFIVTDDDTEEVLVRSYVKHDGVMKQPNMAVTMANDWTGIASERLRRVVAFEVQKLRDEQPDLPGWKSEKALMTLLSTEGLNVKIDPSGKSSDDPLSMGRTTTTATSTTTATPLLEEGGVPFPASPKPPSPFCKRHQASEGTDHPCRGCKLAAQKYDEYMTEAAPPDQPYVHEHRWMPDGTCMTCEEVRPG